MQSNLFDNLKTIKDKMNQEEKASKEKAVQEHIEEKEKKLQEKFVDFMKISGVKKL